MKINLDILKNSYLDLVYPIGSIYMSVNSTNPSTLFGGTWERIEGKFLLGADSTYIAGSTGGKNKVTLSANIGACNSNVGTIGYIAEGRTAYQATHGAGLVPNTGSTNSFNNWNHSVPVTEYWENSRDVNIMNPYLAVYMWKRIA